MCHLVLFMPVFALPIFWLLPLPLAAGIYAVIVALSAWLYYIVFKIMHRAPLIGLETLSDARGRVLQADGRFGFVRIGNELWKAEADHELRDNDDVKVVARHGFVLRVAERGEEDQTDRARPYGRAREKTSDGMLRPRRIPCARDPAARSPRGT